MKKLIVFRMLTVLLLLAGAASASAQDPRLAGVWKRHVSWSGIIEYDRFIRIDIDESRVFVAIKEMGNTVDGTPFQSYWDASNITVNSDGSVSFIVYLNKRVFVNEDHLYWTVYDSYTIRAEGSRLNATEGRYEYGENSQGRIVKDKHNIILPNQYTYFNINDNW